MKGLFVDDKLRENIVVRVWKKYTGKMHYLRRGTEKSQINLCLRETLPIFMLLASIFLSISALNMALK